MNLHDYQLLLPIMNHYQPVWTMRFSISSWSWCASAAKASESSSLYKATYGEHGHVLVSWIGWLGCVSGILLTWKKQQGAMDRNGKGMSYISSAGPAIRDATPPDSHLAGDCAIYLQGLQDHGTFHPKGTDIEHSKNRKLHGVNLGFIEHGVPTTLAPMTRCPPWHSKLTPNAAGACCADLSPQVPQQRPSEAWPIQQPAGRTNREARLRPPESHRWSLVD